MNQLWNQLWLVLMSAFVVLGFLATMVCSIWLVKIVLNRLLIMRGQRTSTRNV